MSRDEALCQGISAFYHGPCGILSCILEAVALSFGTAIVDATNLLSLKAFTPLLPVLQLFNPFGTILSLGLLSSLSRS